MHVMPMVPPDAALHVTTALLIKATLIAAPIDAAFIWLLTRNVPPEAFRRLRGPIVAIAFVAWFAIWLYVGAIRYWDVVYRYVFPSWARWVLPPAQGLLTALATLGAWWLAARARSHPVPRFLLLGALWGVLTHVWAVSRGIMDRPPLLQGASPIAAVVFAGTEFAFYFCVVLAVANLVGRGGRPGAPSA
jgi:hypothetical protein